jgi:hypothetical protein
MTIAKQTAFEFNGIFSTIQNIWETGEKRPFFVQGCVTCDRGLRHCRYLEYIALNGRMIFFSLALQPPWALASLSVSWSFLQSVGLLGRVISSLQGLYLNTGQHKHRINTYTHQTSIPCVGFEPTNPASERAKTVHALDRSATVTGGRVITAWIGKDVEGNSLGQILSTISAFAQRDTKQLRKASAIISDFRASIWIRGFMNTEQESTNSTAKIVGFLFENKIMKLFIYYGEPGERSWYSGCYRDSFTFYPCMYLSTEGSHKIFQQRQLISRPKVEPRTFRVLTSTPRHYNKSKCSKLLGTSTQYWR